MLIFLLLLYFIQKTANDYLNKNILFLFKKKLFEILYVM